MGGSRQKKGKKLRLPRAPLPKQTERAFKDRRKAKPKHKPKFDLQDYS